MDDTKWSFLLRFSNNFCGPKNKFRLAPTKKQPQWPQVSKESSFLYLNTGWVGGGVTDDSNAGASAVRSQGVSLFPTLALARGRRSIQDAVVCECLGRPSQVSTWHPGLEEEAVCPRYENACHVETAGGSDSPFFLVKPERTDV